MHTSTKLTGIIFAAVLSTGCVVAPPYTYGVYTHGGYVDSYVDDAWYDYPYEVRGGYYYYYHPRTRVMVHRSPTVLVRPRMHEHRIHHEPQVIIKQHYPRIEPRVYERRSNVAVPQQHNERHFVPQQRIERIERQFVPQHRPQERVERRQHKEWRREKRD